MSWWSRLSLAHLTPTVLIVFDNMLVRFISVFFCFVLLAGGFDTTVGDVYADDAQSQHVIWRAASRARDRCSFAQGFLAWSDSSCEERGEAKKKEKPGKR